MKYFTKVSEISDADRESCTEFRLSCAVEEFWDKTSLYMSEDTMDKTGFCGFLNECVYKGILFDSDGFSRDELAVMSAYAAKIGGAVSDIINELAAWMESDCNKQCCYVAVIGEHDRIMAENIKTQK